MLSIIFFGTDEFAAHILSELLSAGKKVLAVVTKPDRAKKRGGEPLPSPVKSFLEKTGLNLPLFQPEKASTSDFAQRLRTFAPDLFVVVSYGEIMNEELLGVAKVMPINIHPSALPKYRGASPLRSAILAGEERIVVCVIEMVKAMDAGDILKSGEIRISLEENHSDVQKRMFVKAAEVLRACLEDFENNVIVAAPQVGEVTFTKKFNKEDAWIDWTKNIDDIVNKIRAFGDSPGALATVQMGNKELVVKITKALKYSSEKSEKVVTVAFSKGEGWLVGCRDGVLKIMMLQPENKKLMSVQDFINGAHGQVPRLIAKD
jgi:methionyl-tRNA formyltransferase